MRTKVLWIEDSARFEYSSWVAPVYYSGDYDFQIAENVTKAMDLIESDEYDVIIADLRLPPGNDRHWQTLYEHGRANQRRAQLGLDFLTWLLGKDGVNYDHKPPQWASPARICVFTVEIKSEISETLDRLGIRNYEIKTAGHPDTILVDLIHRVLDSNGSPTNALAYKN